MTAVEHINFRIINGRWHKDRSLVPADELIAACHKLQKKAREMKNPVSSVVYYMIRKELEHADGSHTNKL